MNRFKKALAIALSAALMVPSTAFAATSSPVKTVINGKKAELVTEYTGKDQTLKITIDGKELVEGKDFVLVDAEPTEKGSYTLTIKGTGLFEGTATIAYTIKKAEQPVVKMDKKVEKKLAKGFKATNLKKKSKTIDLGVKGKKAKELAKKANLTYSAKGKKAKKWLKVTKDGKVTLKKGIKKGVYKVRVKAKKGTKSYKKGTVVIKIVVK